MTAAFMAATALLFVLPGALAYLGRWRGWASSARVLFAPLALLWIGAGAELVFAGVLCADAGLQKLGQIVGLIGFAGVVLGALFLFWTPLMFRPRWHRELKG
ncbi:hypothetical protein ACIBG8_23795 [Nonomuraea sp. NPDC050556]|uniref:hypothetical protein n=1 Tax=Nonomuraea sp. NPDC050556 TaxID=3364369 RepID=UPI0037A88F22